MKRMTLRVSALAICLGLVAFDAAAWGPKTRQAIAMAALQIVRREAPFALIAGEVSYEADLLQGATDGAAAARSEIPLHDDAQTIDAVGTYIQIMREARVRGAGSHFAYRMGVLSAIVSDAIQPFGFAFTDAEEVLRDQIRADLDANVHEYTYSAQKRHFSYVRSPRLYFDEKRSFFDDDRLMIADEYKRGVGYRGFLDEAAPIYFDRAVDAVADVWFTVFREAGDRTDVDPSERQMSLYYIDELGYLLRVLESMEYADRAYRTFQEISPQYWEAYIEIGDLFYEFGTEEGLLRAVEEWKIAQRSTGQARKMASQRLSTHFIEAGERLFVKSTKPEAEESDLSDALHSFEQALEFDRTNDVAARRISETAVAISKRQQDYELQQKFLDTAMGIVKQAERGTMSGDYAGALDAYNQALRLVDIITPEFKDLHATARENSSSIKKEIKGVIGEVLDAANESIERGDTQMLSSDYDNAIKEYAMVEHIVRVIPGEDGSINAQRKNDLIDTANAQMGEAEAAKRRAAQSKAAEEPDLSSLNLGNN